MRGRPWCLELPYLTQKAACLAWDGFGLDGWSQSALLRAWQTEYWSPQLKGYTVGSEHSVWTPGKLSAWCGSQAGFVGWNRSV